MVKMIVGLGNPGAKYAATRHNCGFMVLAELARRFNIQINKNEHNALTGVINYQGEKILLCQGQSFMNLSGFPLQALCSYYKIDYQDLLVIFDDMDLPCGLIRLRKEGSHGGHNGMRSIIEQTGTEKINRIKIGINHPLFGNGADYVLGVFSTEEQEVMREAILQAADAALLWAAEGMDAAMRKYNKKAQKAVEEEQVGPE